eukprot:9965550-Heterocapsa_arctica.AAC.1
MLKHAEAMPGWEERAEDIRAEMKDQLVQWKDKEKKEFKKAMVYHQQKADFNTREYQKKKLEIRTIYTELEDLGWNQVVSDDGEDGESVSSDDAAAYMAANANA